MVRGGILPRNDGPHGGTGSRQDAPPIFFLRHQKENAPRPVEKKKCSAQTCTNVQVCLNTRVGVRWCLRVCGGCPTGAAGYRRDLAVDSRGAGADETRGARTHLTSFSFRAFRFATRCPGGRGGLYQRADVGIRPYGEAGPGPSVGADLCVGPCRSANPSVGADAHIRPKA